MKFVNFPSERKEPCEKSFLPFPCPWRQNVETQIFEVVLNCLRKLGPNVNSSNLGLNNGRVFRCCSDFPAVH
eukprot:3467918-Rhodomonas_salina.1